jgi:uncharacterized protein YijF (DUF1287 family)
MSTEDELRRMVTAGYIAIQQMSNEDLKQVIKAYKKLWNFAKLERSKRRRKSTWKKRTNR